MPLDPELLSRFHRALVDEIRRKRPEYLDHSFTVAEIYQELVPYRTHRNVIGVAMNGDYEDALLRLLAGEGNYLVLGSEPARRELRKELESSNPNTGLYREFATVDVRLNPEVKDWVGPDLDSRVADGTDGEGAWAVGNSRAETSAAPRETDGAVAAQGRAEADEGGTEPHEARLEPHEARLEPHEAGPEPDEARLEPDEAMAEPHEGVAVGGTEEGAAKPRDRESSAAAVADTGSRIWSIEDSTAGVTAGVTGGDARASRVRDESPGGSCSWCEELLPERSGMSYCPHCGGDVRLVPCPACGEALERSWRFCVACGTEVAAS